MNGHTLLELLLKKYELQLEMAAGNYVLALASVMDTDEGFDRLADALIEIDSQLEKYKSDFEEFYDILKQEGVVHSILLSCQNGYNHIPKAACRNGNV